MAGLTGWILKLEPFRLTSTIQTPTNSLSSNDVRAILEDRRGNLWIGTYGGGLNLFNRDSGQFTHYTHNAEIASSLADNRVMSIYEDKLGNLWIGTRGGGLDRMDRNTGRFTHFRHDPKDPASLSGDFVRTIYEDHTGKLWIGTYNGVSIMDPNTHTFKRYQNRPNDLTSLSDDRVLSILETVDGAVWIGTLLGGVNRFDPVTQNLPPLYSKAGSAQAMLSMGSRPIEMETYGLAPTAAFPDSIRKTRHFEIMTGGMVYKATNLTRGHTFKTAGDACILAVSRALTLLIQPRWRIIRSHLASSSPHLRNLTR